MIIAITTTTIVLPTTNSLITPTNKGGQNGRRVSTNTNQEQAQLKELIKFIELMQTIELIKLIELL